MATDDAGMILARSQSELEAFLVAIALGESVAFVEFSRDA
jgi:hypothetical protein